ICSRASRSLLIPHRRSRRPACRTRQARTAVRMNGSSRRNSRRRTAEGEIKGATRTGGGGGMAAPDLLDAMTRRLEAYGETQDPDLVLSAQALAECDALVLLVDNPVDESEEDLDAFLAAVSVVAWFHWARYVASDEDDQPALLAAMALFQMLYQIDPEAVPPELAEQFSAADMPLQPMKVLWEAMASEIIEQAIAEQDASGADEAVFLLERAL